MLNDADRDRIEAAVAEAEAGSRGEIVCVLSGEVSRYREMPLAWGEAAALAIPPVAVLAGLHPLGLASLGGAWTIAHSAAVEEQLGLAITLYAAAQAVLFTAVAGLAAYPPIRRLLTPGFLKAHRVHQAAQRQFAAVSTRAVGSDTGVLIFVALVDRKVEILADAAIHQKCGEAVWKAAAAVIGAGMKTSDPTDGIVNAIALCGAALREHFPAGADNPNVLSNRPVEI